MKHRSLYAGDRDIGPLLPGFLGRLAENVRLLEAMRAGNDFEGIRKLAHQLKGAGASYGFAELSRLANLVEAEIRAAGSLEFAGRHLDSLVAFAREIEGFPG